MFLVLESFVVTKMFLDDVTIWDVVGGVDSHSDVCTLTKHPLALCFGGKAATASKSLRSHGHVGGRQDGYAKRTSEPSN